MEIKNKIAVDGDDVLIKTIHKFNDFYNHHHSTKFLVEEDYFTFDLPLIWGISRDEVRILEREFLKSEFYEDVTYVEGAFEAIDFLSKEYDITVITGRGMDVEKHLHSTLEKLYEPHHFRAIYHVGNSDTHGFTEPKWQRCKKDKIPLLIDDYQGHLLKASKEGIHGILMTAPWNKYIWQLPDNIYRARNWEEALEIIEKKKNIIFR